MLLSLIALLRLSVTMKTTAVALAFDLFGSAGTAAGARLLLDELREILADNRRETAVTRAQAYTGHIRLREIDFTCLDDYSHWRRQARQVVRAVFRQGDFLLYLGGNHLSVLPIYDELADGTGQTLVLQFDAHLDIHHFRDTSTELSHGNFLRYIDGPPPLVVNVGHRDLLLPTDHIASTFHKTIPATRLASEGQRVLAELQQLTQSSARILVDIDCDVFDPSYFPGVAQPVPFGPTPAQILALLDALWSERFIGLSLSEFDPARDQGDRSLATLVWLIEWALLRRYEK